MRYEGGNAYVSYMGAFCSLIFILISLAFLYSKIMVLIEVSGVTLMQNLKVATLTFDDKISAKQHGLFLAAALTPYDSTTEPIYDSRYGELIIEHYGWGNDGEISVTRRELENHQCSEAELGLSAGTDEHGASSSFAFPIFATSYNVVNTWKKKFRCMRREDLEIWGDYNSDKA